MELREWDATLDEAVAAIGWAALATGERAGWCSAAFVQVRLFVVDIDVLDEAEDHAGRRYVMYRDDDTGELNYRPYGVYAEAVLEEIGDGRTVGKLSDSGRWLTQEEVDALEAAAPNWVSLHATDE